MLGLEVIHVRKRGPSCSVSDHWQLVIDPEINMNRSNSVYLSGLQFRTLELDFGYAEWLLSTILPLIQSSWFAPSFKLYSSVPL